MIVFLVLIGLLNSLFICNLFFKLTLNDNKIDLKTHVFLVISMSIVILGFGFSPFVWGQFPACGLLLILLINKLDYQVSDRRTTLFIISFILLFISLINYFEGLITNDIVNYFPNLPYKTILISILFQIVNLGLISIIPNRVYQRTFRALNNNNFYNTTFFILLSSLIIFILYTTNRSLEAINNTFGLIPGELAVYITVNLFLIVVLINYSMYRHEQTIQKELMNNMTAYTREVEDLYDELSMFRHDYLNILFSLRMAIDSRDIDEVEKIFKDSIMPTEKIVNDESYETAKLNRMKVSEIKSILHMKLCSARMEGIEVSIDIPDNIYSLGIDTILYLRIISILLDNAIESAKEALEKNITIAIFEYENVHVLAIGNSTKEVKIDLIKIFQKNYSGKKNRPNDRGWGLYYLKSIIIKNDGITLETKFEKSYFSQTIRIVSPSVE